MSTEIGLQAEWLKHTHIYGIVRKDEVKRIYSSHTCQVLGDLSQVISLDMVPSSDYFFRG